MDKTVSVGYDSLCIMTLAFSHSDLIRESPSLIQPILSLLKIETFTLYSDFSTHNRVFVVRLQYIQRVIKRSIFVILHGAMNRLVEPNHS